MVKKILLVDDDELVLAALKILLTLEHFQVRTVAKAERVDDEISDFLPDLIVMDIWLDSADGRVICDRLK